jgi:hypothetical protein
VTTTKPANDTGASATGEETTHKLSKKRIDQIKAWEAEAEGLTGEADNFRAQAASYIVMELEAGATERQLAEAIGKSPGHVHHAAKAWRLMQSDDFKVAADAPDRFNQAYKKAKQKAVTDTEGQTDGEGGGDDDAAEQPYPAWSKQVKAFNNLVPVMIDQGSLKQIRQLLSMLGKQTKAAASKEQDLDSVPDSAAA